MLIYSLPIIAALTGYITNFLAVKMLFHPRKPVKLLFVTFQGIFPKRQEKLAEKLGQIVAQELFSVDDILDSLKKPEQRNKMHEVIESKIDDFLQNQLVQSMPMLGMFMNDELKGQIKQILSNEFENMLPALIDELGAILKDDLDVEKVVYRKVANFSSDKLEQILYSIMRKEFTFIEILGGVLGFFIGLIQLLLVQIS